MLNDRILRLKKITKIMAVWKLNCDHKIPIINNKSLEQFMSQKRGQDIEEKRKLIKEKKETEQRSGQSMDIWKTGL